MKRWIIGSLIAITSISLVSADIQAPPGAEYTSSRKLGRGLSNILYGLFEIPIQLSRKVTDHGPIAGTTWGVVDGTKKGLKRIGYGFYETLTFHCPTYKGTFKPPYEKCGADWRQEMNPNDGLSEFPAELGPETFYRYSRTQQW